MTFKKEDKVVDVDWMDMGEPVGTVIDVFDDSCFIEWRCEDSKAYYSFTKFEYLKHYEGE